MHRGGCGPGFPDDVPGLGSAGRHHSGCRTVQPKRRAMGRVTIFCPADPRMPYPDQWYSNAAVTVREMGPPFSIHDPENIREYYRRLFHGKKDKLKLRAAIDSRSFAQTAAEYRLIDNAGAQVIVPYSGADVSYASIAKRMRDEGVTHALLKEAAPITVICFAKNLKIYAEEIPFAGHGKTQAAGSGVFCFARSIPICIPTSLAYICRRKKASSQYSEMFTP